jgi:uncharacterized transporter YbjL
MQTGSSSFVTLPSSKNRKTLRDLRLQEPGVFVERIVEAGIELYSFDTLQKSLQAICVKLISFFERM